MRQFAIILFFLILGFTGKAHTAEPQHIPFSGSTLKLTLHPSDEGTASTRTVEILGDGPIRINWDGIAKELASDDPYPRYKIIRQRGVLQIDGLSGRDQLFHPAFWGRGFVKLEDALPLWVDPIYLSTAKSLRFNIGLLKPGRTVQQLAPDDLFEKMTYFSSLYDHYILNGKPNDAAKMDEVDRKALREFARNWSNVESIAKTKVELSVNKQKVNVAARIIGNEYYHLVVLDDERNPLVLSFRIFPDKVPTPFKKVFGYFKNALEFQVTRINR